MHRSLAPSSGQSSARSSIEAPRGLTTEVSEITGLSDRTSTSTPTNAAVVSTARSKSVVNAQTLQPPPNSLAKAELSPSLSPVTQPNIRPAGRLVRDPAEGTATSSEPVMRVSRERQKSASGTTPAEGAPVVATSPENDGVVYSCPVRKHKRLKFKSPKALFTHCVDHHTLPIHGDPKFVRQQEQVLLWAAEGGYGAVVRLLLLENRLNLEIRTEDKERTPLALAAYRGHEVVVRLLLEKGANLESRGTNSRTPLAWAAYWGYDVVVGLLLEKGANLESQDTDSRTPLVLAACEGHDGVVGLLLEKGADLESQDTDSRTPLVWAAYRGHAAVVGLLLEKGADLESRDMYLRTPLAWAAYWGYDVVVELLLEKGANLESRDMYSRTPLTWAVYQGHVAVVGLLLENGANPKVRDRQGKTPLSLARKGKTSAIADLLEEWIARR